MIEYTVKVYSDGYKAWYLNGKFHREDGPAVEHSNGSKYWWLNGERHREDGPAVELNNGTKSWYLNGKEFTEEEYNERMNPKPSSCNGKMVTIDGKQYKLTEVE